MTSIWKIRKFWLSVRVNLWLVAAYFSFSGALWIVTWLGFRCRSPVIVGVGFGKLTPLSKSHGRRKTCLRNSALFVYLEIETGQMLRDFGKSGDAKGVGDSSSSSQYWLRKLLLTEETFFFLLTLNTPFWEFKKSHESQLPTHTRPRRKYLG